MCGETCVICLETIKGEPIKTPCNHVMHNKCLTTWLISENTCPICRYDIGEEFSKEVLDQDDNHDDRVHLSIQFNNDIITSHYDKIRNAIFEIARFLSDSEEPVYTNNDWTTNGCDSYFLKIKTKTQIIEIVVDCFEIDNIKRLLVTFNTIDKKINYHRNMINKNNIYVSKYNGRKIPIRSLWLH